MIEMNLQMFGGRGGGSGMSGGGGAAASSSSARPSSGGAPVTSLMANAESDPLMNKDLAMSRNQVKDYFDTIGYKYSNSMLDTSAGASANQLDHFSDIKRARINAEKLPKTGDSYMDKPSNVKDYYMATMASSGDSRATMNKFWGTTPGKVDLANWFKGEVGAGLTGSEMKSTVDSMKRRRR